MVVCKDLKELQPKKDCVVSIGTFDGIHLGHQSLLNEIKYIARDGLDSVLITFDPHPQQILNPQKNKKLLTTIEKKISLIEKFGIQNLIVIPFSKNISNISADEFLKNIIIRFFNPKFIIVGHDHHFGHNREGNYQLLKSREEIFGYNSILLGPLEVDGKIINSTLIRNCIKNNDIESANKYLGWEYELVGKIKQGSGRGVNLSFPTANLEPVNKDQLIPANGSYCIRAEFQGYIINGMCNIGFRPTFNDTRSAEIEVNLFKDFTNNLYGEKIKITFLKFLRPEKKFNSTDELISQLKIDREVCKQYLEV